MHDERVLVLENRKINDEYWKLTFSSGKLSRRVLPGQFVHIQVEPGSDPFLRRPFSYYRVKGNRVEILYEILGRGTAILASKKKGDALQVMGPLGKPFSRAIGKRKRVMIAGGVGVPPLVFLAEKSAANSDYLLIGCFGKGEVLPRAELKNIGTRILYATENGSYGKKGLVTALLNELLEKENPAALFIQTCGPHGMMKAVMDIAKARGVEGEASLDERMACGVGACLGCMVKTVEGYKTSCVDGPVFDFKELVA